jgi:hypothetical protein
VYGADNPHIKYLSQFMMGLCNKVVNFNYDFTQELKDDLLPRRYAATNITVTSF